MRPNYERLCSGLKEFQERLALLKQEKVSFPWYPWQSLGNILHIDKLVTPEVDHLFSPAKAIADIGAGDGDVAFYLQSKGINVDIYDWPPTNMNGLRAAAHLKNKLNSPVQIFQTDLDSQFLIKQKYDAILFLGILYHLKNPFYILEHLSKRARYIFLSTRIVKTFGADAPDVSEFSAAYFLGSQECYNDPTNYWFFTEAGLTRLLERTGWAVVTKQNAGEVERSNPQDRDERIFILAKSVRE